jgi:succinoglycan biosynthesis transport protein ExoP
MNELPGFDVSVAQAAPRDEQTLSLKSLIAIFRRRIWTFVAVAVMTMLVVTTITFLLPPKYDALARLKINPPSALSSTTGENGAKGLSPETLETEVNVIKSYDTAREVARRLRLDQTITSGAAGNRLNAATSILLSGLTVDRERSAYIINIRFRSDKPDQGARIANAFAETYIETNVGSRTGTAAKQAQFLNRSKQRLDAEVQSADARLAQYRAQAGIVQGAAGTIADQQVAPISGQLATAQSMAAESRAKLASASRQINSGGLDAVSGALYSPVIADLRRQRAGILQTMTDVESRYGPKHPESIKAGQQLKSVDQQIDAEAKRVYSALQSDASAADARVESLRSSLNSLEGQQESNSRASVTAAGLEREAQNKREAYERINKLLGDANQQARDSLPQADIIDFAKPSAWPSSPNRPLLLSVGLVLAMTLGIGAVAAREMTSSGLRTLADMEGRTGFPLLASVPQLTKAQQKADGMLSPADMIVLKPGSLYAEAFRNVRTSLITTHQGRDPHVLAMVSSVPEEGKTTSALSLARILALNGDKTVLLDCDLRRGALRKAAPPATDGHPGIVEVLNGDATLDDALVEDQVAGLSILSVRESHFAAADPFSGDAMKALLATLRQDFTRIVIDTPPLLGVAEARTLACLADAVILVVKWDDTRADAVSGSVALLRGDRAHVAGTLYSMVDVHSEAIGSIYYSSKYAHYYTKD